MWKGELAKRENAEKAAPARRLARRDAPRLKLVPAD
jgi:hypothetical protein